ncbi:MAG TPA: hypothetical protein VNU97_16790 [Rhizomicrobium sp.]|jgi:hypothetical protein|nr:hypothetical protein [Rhizomicrobium sp.]
MLTKADDFPVHQLPEPIATSGTDRNFYDRYFFNGYSPDGDVFFAVALGVYPHLNVMDAALSVIDGGVQHNLRASRLLHMERLDTTVGPIAVEVVEPLKTLRIRVGDNPHGMKCDITFHARALPVEEPRFTYRQGPRTVMDYTRLTQNGSYDGWIEVAGRRIALSRARIVGTRDRSWGVRPIGLGDPQGVAPPRAPQFYWLWSPLNFPDRFMLYHNNANADGTPWNTASVIGGTGAAKAEHMASCRSTIAYKQGTRHAQRATIETKDADGGEWHAELTPKFHFYMSGIGYGHPEWGHGHYKGENALGYDSYRIDDVNENEPRFQHIQAFVTARLTGPGGVVADGVGVLEQLVVGAFAPHGLTGVFDPAP